MEKLTVGSRDQTKLVEGVIGQVELVRSLIDVDCPVLGVLCFIEADWPLIGGAFTARGIEVLWPKKLEARLLSDGPHTMKVQHAEAQLAKALPPA